MLGTFGVLLVILKLAGVIGWAWWIVLIPFYPILLTLVMASLFGVIGQIWKGN